MTINLTGLTAFGDMTDGDGLAGIMDASTANVGYSQAVTGYAGVTLAAPTKIASADFISANNGFDASSNTTQITLKLYGKVGSAPLNSTDGDLLGSITFTDANVNTTKTITSSNQSTAYNHVWATLSTGVWCILAAFKPCAVVEYQPPEPVDMGTKHTVIRQVHTAVPLTHHETEVAEFRVNALSDSDAIATLDFQADIVHNSLDGYTGVLACGCVLVMRVGDTWEDMKAASKQIIQHGIVGSNIYDATGHYTTHSRTAKVKMLADKYYQFSVDLLATRPASTVNGQASLLVEGGNGINSFIVTVDKNETLTFE